MINFSQELNTEQLKVVETGDGPCLVLAGAGSGKTRTVCYRVAYLLEKGVPPENILLVTFTNKAASEMKERVARLVSGGTLPWSGTFHHIAYRILRQYAPLLGYTNNFTVLDSADSESLIKLCIKEVKSDHAGARFPSASVVNSLISYGRNAQLPLEQVIEIRYYQWIQHASELTAIAEAYTKKKKEANAMDFDDLLVNLFLLLHNNEKILQKFATQFHYILVDEYQDTNKIQASIIRQFASAHNNLLVVGDDAQSIYSFRGADIHNILGFELTYPGARVFKLEINYRSTQEILSVANNVIANNHEQYKKDLRVVKLVADRDLPRPALYPQIDQSSEAVFIAKKIQEHITQGISPKEIAVLFRAAHHSQMLEVELVQRGIAYDYRGGVRFFDRAHIKDILSYLRIMTNLSDTAAWLRVLMHEEGIGLAAAQKIVEAVRTVIPTEPRGRVEESLLPTSRDPSTSLRSAQDDSWGRIASVGREVLGQKGQVGWNHFISIWQTIIDTPARVPGKLIEALANSPYRDYLESEYLDSRDRLADIKQLAIFAERYTNTEEFLAEMTLQESFRTINAEGDGGGPASGGEKIVLSTIHQAKGLEWSAVFVMNLSSGAFPSERAMKEDNGLEEERRLLYVAITRAKKFLYLTYPMAGGSFGDFLSGPSMFLNEINPDLLEDHSLLSTSSSVFNDSSAGVEYIDEDAPILKKKPPSGSFLADISDL
ncbi:MAG: ATP-dependent helicase [Candidatus Magasanikbacteria bacterium]|nr:ATP-dependent helicase [Candidatus Magasanikbacteria bacterium]